MILLTLDTSSASESAIDVAVELAKRFDVDLHLLLVIDGPLRAAFAETARERGGEVDDVARDYVERMVTLARRFDLPVEGAFRHSIDAGSAIVEAANADDVDLVVMATHGRTGLSRLLAGSVTDYVIRHSVTPVVAVPVRGQE